MLREIGSFPPKNRDTHNVTTLPSQKKSGSTTQKVSMGLEYFTYKFTIHFSHSWIGNYTVRPIDPSWNFFKVHGFEEFFFNSSQKKVMDMCIQYQENVRIHQYLV